MKKFLFLYFVVFVALITNCNASDEKLLNLMHEYGIQKCDNFIIENSSLDKLSGTNWQFYINKQMGGIDGPTTEVTIMTIYGEINDTVKVEDTYIQSPKNCYLTTRSITTFPGSCESNVNADYWYISNDMPKLDYTTYTNKNGVDMYAKEIKVGNFKACIQEVSIRKSGHQNK